MNNDYISVHVWHHEMTVINLEIRPRHVFVYRCIILLCNINNHLINPMTLQQSNTPGCVLHCSSLKHWLGIASICSRILLVFIPFFDKSHHIHINIQYCPRSSPPKLSLGKYSIMFTSHLFVRG